MKKGGFVLVLWMMLVVSVGVGKKGYDEEVPNNIEEIAVRVTAATSPNSYWGWNRNWKEEVQKVVNRALTYLFPPKIDFRPGKPVEDDAQVTGGDANMKDALTKTLHNTKQMVEDSANVAAQTLQQPKPHSEL